ncbi:YdcF family protein [Paenibacillus filicis]|uniref:YdcF family protein n=1 Tax=Paenibacillus gyeongsangnamensis TaxID=3388067 RepID=A0ABT4Q894_9BACL|nr:YdcF family protein [Paenibacillus filicis]MCZ8513098.1 YdcF family protein [Paenibacillus filicis]
MLVLRRWAVAIKPSLWKGAKRLLMAVLLIIGIAAFWTGYVLWSMASMPDTSLPKQDAGIVLGAALWQTTPSPALKERLNRAAELYEEGKIRSIIVSGGYDRPDSQLTEAEGMRDYLLGRGIPGRVILLENHATNTYENLLFSKQIMDEHGYRSAVIVTHRYHAVRSLDIARFLGYDHPAAAPMDSSVLMMSWHKSRETLAYTKWQWDKIRLRLGV